MNKLVIAAIAVLAVLYLAFSSIYIVNEREQAIVTRFGQITEVRTEPGLYFKVPTNVVDDVLIIEDRLLRYDLADMTLQVSGGQFYVVDAFVTYRIANPRLFRERALGDLNVAEQRIGTRFEAALRQVYGLREFDAALSEQRPQMMEEARDLIRPDMAELGIEVVDVRIRRTDLTAQVSQETYQRMRAERLAEAALLRARGQERAQALRAIADRQAVEIVAASRRDAEILRGEGDGERNRIFASAYGADPEFFQFYRSMESYLTAMATSGTTMVLSPDSEFFRYFGANGLENTGLSAGGAGTPATPVPQTTPVPTLSAPAAEPAEPALGIDGLPLAPIDPELDIEPQPVPTDQLLLDEAPTEQ